MTTAWAKPAPSEGGTRNVTFWKPADYDGALLGFHVVDFKPNSPNGKYPPKDAMVADITVLDGPKAGEIVERAQVNAAVLVRQLKYPEDHERQGEPMIGEKVLGRLSKHVETSNGKAWGLQIPTEADIEIANGAKPAEKKAPWES